VKNIPSRERERERMAQYRHRIKCDPVAYRKHLAKDRARKRAERALGKNKTRPRKKI